MESKEKNNVKVEKTNNGGMNEFWGNLSENETVFCYFGSDSLMSFNGEDDEETAWAAMNERGYQMKKDAAKATVNVKKILAKLVIENLENVPESLHDLSGEIVYGKMRNEINNMSRKNIEKILFFETLPELGKLGMLKRKEMLILGGESETVYYM